MKYMLLIYGDEQARAQATPEQLQAQADAYDAFTKSIVASGNFLDGDRVPADIVGQDGRCPRRPHDDRARALRGDQATALRPLQGGRRRRGAGVGDGRPASRSETLS